MTITPEMREIYQQLRHEPDVIKRAELLARLRWVRIEFIKRRFALVSVRRESSKKWVMSDREIALSRFSDGKGDYKLVEGK